MHMDGDYDDEEDYHMNHRDQYGDEYDDDDYGSEAADAFIPILQ